VYDGAGLSVDDDLDALGHRRGNYHALPGRLLPGQSSPRSQ
jgi:hypothetical protein